MKQEADFTNQSMPSVHLQTTRKNTTREKSAQFCRKTLVLQASCLIVISLKLFLQVKEMKIFLLGLNISPAATLYMCLK